MLFILTYLLFGIILPIQEKSLREFEFLIGTWKIENREQYEVWEKISDSKFKGEGYRIKDGEKDIFEYLEIAIENENIVYKATVPDQNDGKAIPFILNSEVRDLFSFENKGHDFPKKIQYQRTGNDKIFVRVLGDNNEGFFLNFIRQQSK